MKGINLFRFIYLILVICAPLLAQGPWNAPLRIAFSNDGAVFTDAGIFQDSSGVPSVIRRGGDTLIAVFQWFRLPNPSPSWDRVAVKFSYNDGATWTAPQPITVSGFPVQFQRPFDPTIVKTQTDSIRIYYSSSNGMPQGLDSAVNTYSAISKDGINYRFEGSARVDINTGALIDPAVTYFKNVWHYISPKGAPQDGAHHFSSVNGLFFTPLPPIPSDNTHNWTGNLMSFSDTLLRFYGSGPFIWYNTSSDGMLWNGYVNTNLRGGDPSAIRLQDGRFLMIYVGGPYTTGIENNKDINRLAFRYDSRLKILTVSITEAGLSLPGRFSLYSISGELVLNKIIENNFETFNLSVQTSGVYVLQFTDAQSRVINDKITLLK